MDMDMDNNNNDVDIVVPIGLDAMDIDQNNNVDENPYLHQKVISTILKCMRQADLLNARLVCSKWNEVYLMDHKKEIEEKVIMIRSQEDCAQFVKAFSGSSSFQFSKFTIGNHLFFRQFVNSFDKPVVKFLLAIKESIQELKLLLSPYFSHIPSPLCHQPFFPNLSILQIFNWTNYRDQMEGEELDSLFPEGHPENWEEKINIKFSSQPMNHYQISLPALKIVEFEEDMTVHLDRFFESLQILAPELNSISFPTASNGDELEDMHTNFFLPYSIDYSQKVLFTTLKFRELSNVAASMLYTWSTDSQLKLTHLEVKNLVFDEDTSIADFIKFLKTQCNFLKVLKFGGQKTWIDTTPIVPAVPPMEIDSDGDTDHGSDSDTDKAEELFNQRNQINLLMEIQNIFPCLQTLALNSSSLIITDEYFLTNQQFPNLMHLDLSYSSFTCHRVKDFIASSNQFPGLTSLTLSYDVASKVENFLKTFSDKFPNITKLDYKVKSSGSNDFSSINKLWTLWPSSLKYLTISITPNPNSYHHWFRQFEEFLTGSFGGAFIRRLGPSRYVSLNRKPSIADSKELRSLTLIGDGLRISDHAPNFCFFVMQKLKMLCYRANTESPYRFSPEIFQELEENGIRVRAIPTD